MAASRPLIKDGKTVDWLRNEYSARRKKNPSYSLRAFSKQLKIGSGRLSEIFAGKRRVGVRLATKLADRLNYNPEERHLFIKSAKTKRITQDEESQEKPDLLQLEYDTFHLIGDWYHFAILNLIKTTGFSFDINGVASRLSISTTEVRSAVERLTRLKLIEMKAGKMIRLTKSLTTSVDIPSAAIRAFHKQHLQNAEASIENDPVDLRDASGITMAINPAQLPEAKKAIAQFRQRLAKILETGDTKEVYHLAIQLFPLSRRPNA